MSAIAVRIVRKLETGVSKLEEVAKTLDFLANLELYKTTVCRVGVLQRFVVNLQGQVDAKWIVIVRKACFVPLELAGVLLELYRPTVVTSQVALLERLVRIVQGPKVSAPNFSSGLGQIEHQQFSRLVGLGEDPPSIAS